MTMTNSEWMSCKQQILTREFSRMNPQQRQAVFCTEGPLLVLAGAGSGKTTVLINRIANLVRFGRAYDSDDMPLLTAEQEEAVRECAAGVRPLDEELTTLLATDPCPAWRVLAITFTNKAAGELKERLSRMLGDNGDEVSAGTFHSFCARILRRDGDKIGFSRHFTIYDTDDSRRLMKECMRALSIEEKTLGHKAILGEIGRAKDELCSAEEYATRNANGSDVKLRLVSRAYTEYQKRLHDADAMDFDDLIFQTVRLFNECPSVLSHYQERYRYLMVDEYQDTNHAQYELVRLLAERSRNLCVVGDDDQSIYKFRGATVENILGFEEEFAPCRVIRLEQNYRSTKRILDAANHVIAANKGRMGKTLWTENPEGDLLQLVKVDNAEEEGRFVADTILAGVAEGRKFRDFAVLYRANAQSNAIEQALVRSGVPYRIIGGHRFNDTKEVRDAMAYLRIINNPDDTVSLRRIINEPKRGIGDATLDKASAIADGLGESMYTVLLHAEDYPELSRAASRIRTFTDVMEELRRQAENTDGTLHGLYQDMLEKTGYLSMWKTQGAEEEDRVKNLEELESTVRRYEEACGDDYAELSGFLEEQALMTDIDNYDAGADASVLMTMHAAKGLEFPVVLLPGFEDGIFPGLQTLFNPVEMEEDRRLCYVAITRAREQLYLVHAVSRMLYGQTTRNALSRFSRDIPDAVTETVDKCRFSTSDYGYASKRGESFSSFGRSFGGTRYSDEDFSQEWTPSFPSSSNASRSAGTRVTVGQSAVKTASVNWKVGDRICHASFGEGVITAINPMAGDSLLTIQFDTAGTKKIMANYAKLTAL